MNEPRLTTAEARAALNAGAAARRSQLHNAKRVRGATTPRTPQPEPDAIEEPTTVSGYRDEFFAMQRGGRNSLAGKRRNGSGD